jgi:hypothetical protein
MFTAHDPDKVVLVEPTIDCVYHGATCTVMGFIRRYNLWILFLVEGFTKLFSSPHPIEANGIGKLILGETTKLRACLLPCRFTVQVVNMGHICFESYIEVEKGSPLPYFPSTRACILHEMEEALFTIPH